MKATLSKLKARHWDPLSAEQQRSLRWGAWILSPLLVYGLLWQPAREAVGRLQVVLPHLRAQSIQMKNQAVEAQSLQHRAQPSVLESEKLKGVVEAMAAREGWRAPAFSVESAEDNSVRVIAESIAFAQLLRWLNELQQLHHVRVAAVSVSALPEPGQVRMSATLTNGAEQ